LLERVLVAMAYVDRKFFYQGEDVYLDNALPIGDGQTISQPSTVARMLILSELKEGDDVLEVGGGSGWNACLIGFLVYPGSVVSVERIKNLKEKAEKNLARLKKNLKDKGKDFRRLNNIKFCFENIFEKNHAWKRKYDKIIITAGIEAGDEEKIENLAKNLLKDKGILICPYVAGPLIILKKNENIKRFLTQEEYLFVPLLD